VAVLRHGISNVAASLGLTRKDKQRAIHRDLRRFATLITKWCD
jgi:hypothetical protein